MIGKCSVSDGALYSKGVWSSGRSIFRSPPSDSTATTLPDLQFACHGALPGAVRAYYEYPREIGGETLDPTLEELVLAACPSWRSSAAASIAEAPSNQRALAAYRACSFERFGVIEESKLVGPSPLVVSWAMYPWFLEQGLTPAQTRAVTLALMRRERRLSRLPMLDFGERLPSAAGLLPVPAGIVVEISDAAIVIEDQVAIEFDEPMTRDESGYLGPNSSLEYAVEQLEASRKQRGEDWRAPLLLTADASTPFATLIDVVAITSRFEFAGQALIVDSSGELAQLPVLPAPRRIEPNSAEDEPAFLTVEIAADHSISVSRGRDLQQPPTKLDAGDHAKLAKLARALTRDDPRAHRVVISAAPKVPVGVLAPVMAAAHENLPELILIDGHAHEFDPLDTGPKEGVVAIGNYGLLAKPRAEPSVETPSGQVVPTKVKISGTAKTYDLRPCIRGESRGFRQCYEKALALNPKLAGRVTIDFVVDENGKVSSSVVGDNRLADESVAECMAKVIGRCALPKPKPKGAQAVEISQQFELSPH
ncbi:MAG: AgmX/PglI C-terminal domain-containing protein [Enhygromyxa sp.]